MRNALGLALFGTWTAVAYLNNVSVCAHVAADATEENSLESLQYLLLRLRDPLKYQPQAAVVTARLLLAEGRPDPALDVLEVAAESPETEIVALNLTGEALYRVGRLREAGEVWTSVVGRDPRNVAALRWLGIAYYDLGAMQPAVQFLGRAADFAPNDAGPHRLLGLIWKQLGEWSLAVDAFQESLRRDPHQEDALEVRFEIGECLHQLNQHEKAIEMIDAAPEFPDILALRARCEYALGRVEKASSTAERALALDNRHVSTLLLQATIAQKQKKQDEAIDRWRQVTQIDPANREAHYQLAIAYRRLDRADEAEQERLAADQVAKSQDDLQRLTEVAARDPNNIDARIMLGTLCERLHRYRSAREWFRAAVYLDPENKRAKEALVRLLQNSSQTATRPREPSATKKAASAPQSIELHPSRDATVAADR